MAAPGNESDKGNGLQHFSTFPFESDDGYKQGLSSITASGILNGKSEEEKEAILHRSRVFYFNRLTGYAITEEDSRALQVSSNTTKTTPESAPESGEPTILTFTQIKELIEQGKMDLIPNNRHIPDALNEAPPSTSTTPIRKKPWEE